MAFGLGRGDWYHYVMRLGSLCPHLLDLCFQFLDSPSLEHCLPSRSQMAGSICSWVYCKDASSGKKTHRSTVVHTEAWILK